MAQNPAAALISYTIALIYIAVFVCRGWYHIAKLSRDYDENPLILVVMLLLATLGFCELFLG